MKVLKLFFAVPILSLIILSTGTQLSSCTKTTIVDTVYDIKDGLVAYYNFNGGNLNDSSGFGNNISFNNATPTADRFGNPNNAYLFDGSTNYMQVPNALSLNPNNLTLFAIVNVKGFFTGSCTVNEIISKGYPDYTNGFYYMRFSNSTPCTTFDSTSEMFYAGFGDNNPQGTASAAKDITDVVQKSTWYKLTFTYDGQYARLYVNGVLKDTEKKTILFSANSYDLFIGKHEDPPFPFYFKGIIDEVRIYNKALTQGAITQLVNEKN